MRAHLPGIVFLLTAVTVTAGQGAGSPDVPASDVVETGVREEVQVILEEFQILVTDKQGNPILDLKKEDLEVRAGRRKQKIAFLEPFATQDLVGGAVGEILPLHTSPLAPGTSPEPGSVIFVPPPPVRRIVLLFDAFNSRTKDRYRWMTAARKWVEEEMREEDRVCLAVVERNEVRVVAPFTDRKDLLLTDLIGSSIADTENHHDFMLDIRSLMDDLKTCKPAYEPDMCALSAVQPFIHEWRVRTENTMAALKRFSASLAAIPGRKAIFYLSDGLVVNPGETATQAILATLGSDTVSYSGMSRTLERNEYLNVLEALRVANSADVTYFTFDTRHSNMRDVSWMAEEREALNERMVADPFAYMFDETRSAMGTIAAETGGRSFNGPGIEDNLPRAIRAMEGLYTVGFYLDADLAARDRKTRVSVTRKGLQVSYPGETSHRIEPVRIGLDLAIGKTGTAVDGFLLPVMVQVPLKDLTFGKIEGMRTAELGLYAEALTADGRRLADVYEMVVVEVPEGEYNRTLEKKFLHTLNLAVPSGPYRIRVRVSETAFRRAAERSLEITLSPDGSVRSGISPTD